VGKNLCGNPERPTWYVIERVKAMGLRRFLDALQTSGRITSVHRTVSKHLEAAAVLNALEDRPVLFDTLRESPFKVVGNLFGTKQRFADYFGVEARELIPKIVRAIEHPTQPEEVASAACQEVVEQEIDLDRLPILYHCGQDGGNYMTSGVFITKSGAGVQNVDFHRAMQIGKDRFSVRIVKQRDFDTLLKEAKTLPVAVCVGNAPNVLLAAATSVPLGVNELEIANALEPLQVTKPKTFAGLIPAECEFVLEGVVKLEERAAEGPFVDLTDTYDIVRQEPVFQVTCITHRKDALWQALLPGRREHRMLMGMPREPTIYKEVNAAGVSCLDVNVNAGGCSWLHAIIQIEKKHEEDGRRAIEAGFRGHQSCKHVFVVDGDVDIYDPYQVEWAMATRFQADVDLVVKDREKGSSLDPSADPETSFTVKCGFDCTKPLGERSRHFERAVFPQIDLKKLFEG
jgi:UbiD family decarboxylase